MPIQYQPSAQPFGNFYQAVLDALNKAFMPPEIAPSQFAPGEKEKIPQMIANLLMGGSSPEAALESGLLGMGPMPLLTYPEFTEAMSKRLMDAVGDRAQTYMADKRFINRAGPGSIDYAKRQAQISLEGLHSRIKDYGHIMKGVKELQKKLPEAEVFTTPFERIETPLWYSGGFSSNPFAYFIPDTKEMGMVIGQFRDQPISKIVNSIIHEGTHGLQYAKPGIGKEIYNIEMDKLIEPYFNLDDYFEWIKKHDTYRYSNFPYWSKPEEMQAHGVANLLTKKIYPEYEYQMPYPEEWNKYFLNTIDYLLSKRK